MAGWVIPPGTIINDIDPVVYIGFIKNEDI